MQIKNIQSTIGTVNTSQLLKLKNSMDLVCNVCHSVQIILTHQAIVMQVRQYMGRINLTRNMRMLKLAYQLEVCIGTNVRALLVTFLTLQEHHALLRQHVLRSTIQHHWRQLV